MAAGLPRGRGLSRRLTGAEGRRAAGLTARTAALLLDSGQSTHDAVAAVNLPAAGILLYVVVNAYRQRKPAPQPVFITTPEAPLAEVGGNLPQ